MNLRHPTRTATLGVAAGGHADYAAAVAELPISTYAADTETADVVVIDGRTPSWLATVHAAAKRGARGIVLADPGPLTPDEAGRLATLAEQVPVVVDRPRLPRDLVDTVLAAIGDHTTSPARAVIASASAPPGQHDSVLRDLLGWVRELVGTGLRVVGSHRGRDALGAHLLWEGPDGRQPVVVGIHTARGAPALQVGLLGDVCVRLSVSRGARVEIQAESGRWSPPLGHESPERRVLRRLATVLAGDERPADAPDLAADIALTHRVEQPWDRTSGHKRR